MSWELRLADEEKAVLKHKKPTVNEYILGLEIAMDD